MENTIGQAIGIISHVFSVKNDQGDRVKITAKYDLRTCPDEVIKGYIAADRTIAVQSGLRKLTADEIKALDGKTFVFDGLRTKGVKLSPEEAVAAKLKGMSQEEQMKWIRENLLNK